MRPGELLDWHLQSLHEAGQRLLATVGVIVEISHEDGDEMPGVRGTAVGLVVVLARGEEGSWAVALCEIVPWGRLGERFDAAYAYAAAHHALQTRKGTRIPYLSHVLAVAALAMEMPPGNGGGDRRAAARRGRGRWRDGRGVRSPSVSASTSCGSCCPTATPRWTRSRLGAGARSEYLAAMADKAPDELRVSLADKLHNARAILHDLRTSGEDVWSRFNAGRDEVLWYYGELARAFEARKRDLGAGAPFVDELARTVAELRAIAGEGSAPAASGVQAIDDLFAGVADAVGAERPASVTAGLDEADRASLDRLLALVGELRITHTLNRDGELLLPIGDGEWTIVLDRVVLDGDTWVSIEVPLAVGMPEAGDLDPSVAQAVEVLVRDLDSWHGVRSPRFENAVVLMCQLPLEGLSSTALLRAMRRVAWVVDQEQDRARALPATASRQGVWARMPFDRAITADSAGVVDAPDASPEARRVRASPRPDVTSHLRATPGRARRAQRTQRLIAGA